MAIKTAKSKTAELQSLQAKAKKKNLSDLRVETFMSKNPVEIQEGTKIFSAIMILHQHKVGMAPVVDRLGQIVGVVSEHDLLLQTATKNVIGSITYTKNPIVLSPVSTLKDAIILLYTKKMRRIPVVGSSRKVLGVVTRMDVLRRLVGDTASRFYE